jgi:hypothetical protein
MKQLRDDTPTEERERIVNGLRNFLQSDQILVSDTENVVRSTDTAITILNLFFNLGRNSFFSSKKKNDLNLFFVI